MANHLERLELSELAVSARIRFLIDRAGVHSTEAHKVEDKHSWRRIAEFGAAGTCLREAASLMLLLGRDADELLYRAAQSYLLAEHPYGLFLLSLRTRGDEVANLVLNSPMEDWLRKLDRVIPGKKDLSEETDDHEPVAPQLLSINQQLYLCFAMVSMPVIAREHQNSLRRMITIM